MTYDPHKSSLHLTQRAQTLQPNISEDCGELTLGTDEKGRPEIVFPHLGVTLRTLIAYVQELPDRQPLYMLRRPRVDGTGTTLVGTLYTQRTLPLDYTTADEILTSERNGWGILKLSHPGFSFRRLLGCAHSVLAASETIKNRAFKMELEGRVIGLLSVAIHEDYPCAKNFVCLAPGRYVQHGALSRVDIEVT